MIQIAKLQGYDVSLKPIHMRGAVVYLSIGLIEIETDPPIRAWRCDIWKEVNYSTEKWKMIPVITLAHELGHVFDYKHRPWAYTDPYDYNTWMSRMDIEMTAWDYAIRLLTILGFQEWDLFDAIRAFCLENHLEIREEELT